MLNREPPPSPRVAPRGGGGRRIIPILIALVFVVLLSLRGLATLWTDFLWYQSVDLAGVWQTLILSKVLLVAGASVIAFLVIWVNLVVADRLSPRLGMLGAGPDEEIVERFQEWVEPRARRVRLGLAAVLGVLTGLGAGGWWKDALLYLNREPFGQTDPVFGNDIGFYVFRMPMYRDLFGWGFQFLVVTTLLIAALHYLNGGIRIQSGFQRVSPGVKAHLSVLLAALALLRAFGYRLDAWDLLFSERGAVFGASFTDVNAQLPALNLLALISLFAAVLFLVNIRFRGWTLPIVASGLWLVVSIVVGGIIPAAVQRFSVEPGEFVKERDFINRNIAATRAAYGLSDVEVRDFAASGDLTAEDLVANEPTISNIRLWDPTVLLNTYRQLQEIRTYYRFLDVDVDRYPLSELTQLMLVARELDEDNLPGNSWQNRRLFYTHGYGAVVSPANFVSREGLPSFLVKDIPPQSTTDELIVTEPRIYFGEGIRSGSFVITASKSLEIDFPVGSGDERTSYDGAGGVPVASLWRRAAFALRYGDLNTLISGELTRQSKMLMIRNIKERVSTAAPFLHFDSDPYMVVLDGRLVWVVDMYTVTDRYPYSAPAESNPFVGVPDIEVRSAVSRLRSSTGLPRNFNYIRNSVKATVDAYDGTMTFYVIDESDPLVRAYRKVFPEVFADGSQISDELRSHFRYPEDLFRIQSDMYRAYHMTESNIFYNNQDPWQIPNNPSSTSVGDLLGNFSRDEAPMVPYYLLMRLPEDEDLSFLIMQPFTPQDRPNMIAFMIAKSDPDSYGELIEFQLPTGSFIDGPVQVRARINQDPDISREFTLLGQQGSNVIEGNLLVVPIEESVIYVQPIYLQGTGAELPEFKRVVVAFQDRIEMRETLAESLLAVFGGAPDIPDVPDDIPDDGPGIVDAEVRSLLERAAALFDEAQTALQAGDLATYAEKVAEAESLVRQALERAAVQP